MPDRVELDTSSSLILQQTVSGTGVFNGTEVGRAKLSIGAGASELRFRAKNLGAYGNAKSVHLVDPGTVLDRTGAVYDSDLQRVIVTLRRSAGAILATAAEVAAVVNATRDLPVKAYAGGAGVVAAAASALLTGGIDPTVVKGAQYKFVQPANANGGLFYFEQPHNITIRQVEFKLGASVAVTVQLVNLDDGLEEIAAETVDVEALTDDSGVLAKGGVVSVGPQRAIRVNAAAQGVVRVVCHREPVYPY